MGREAAFLLGAAQLQLSAVVPPPRYLPPLRHPSIGSVYGLSNRLLCCTRVTGGREGGERVEGCLCGHPADGKMTVKLQGIKRSQR
jgi:hypothetical protein